MVRGVLDKLPGIKAELVSGKVGWQDWGFTELIRALEEWKAIHPLELAEKASGKPQAPPPPRPPRHRSGKNANQLARNTRVFIVIA